MNSKGFSRDITEATMMCATELIENAIKYSSEKAGNDTIDFNLFADCGTITIIITNRIRSAKDLDNVKKHIKNLQKAEKPAELYTDRLVEFIKYQKPGGSKLGLYRIAYEGDFTLSYSFEDSFLTIRAERNINKN